MSRVTTSYLNPKLSFERSAVLSPITSLVNLQVQKSPEELKLSAKRSEIRKASESVDKASPNLSSPSKDLLSLKRVFKIDDLLDRKNNGSHSPFKRNNLKFSGSAVFRSIDQRIESPPPELEQANSYHRLRNYKPSEANELKAMNQVVEQFKKLSRDNTSELKGSNLNSGLAVDTRKKINMISNHLRSTAILTSADFKKKDLPLNDIIHKKLGLDPATKERQATRLVSNLDKDLSNPLGGRKYSSQAVSTKEDNDYMSRYENILPPNLTNTNYNLNKSQEQKKLPLTQQLSNLLMQGQGGSIGLRTLELNDWHAKGTMRYKSEENQLFQRSDSDNLSFTLQDEKPVENDDHPTIHSLSFPEITIKDEGASVKQDQTPMSSSSLEELAPFKNFLSHSSARPSNSNRKDSEQASKSLTENDKSELKLILSRVTQLLNNERAQKEALVLENQRLNEDILALKTKLRKYEDKDP